jgi:rhomboid protease GluP
VLSAAVASDATKDREQHCEAYFYLGEYQIITGNPQEAKILFQHAVDTQLTSFIEYTAAQAELKRLPATD